MSNLLVDNVKQTKLASRKLALTDTATKNRVLRTITGLLKSRENEIIVKNQTDVDLARTTGLSTALIDRLTLTSARIKSMIDGINEIIDLPDPIGEIVREWSATAGIRLHKIRVPLGVIGIIYESRPNVTIDATCLCLKSGNAVILRGGSESFNSNRILAQIIQDGLNQVGLPSEIVYYISTIEREAVYDMLKLDEYIDVIIPRGNQEMIKSIKSHSLVPVISHGSGNCHIYVDKFADLNIAKKICFNAKVQRPGVCNAMETLLVHQDIAPQFLPEMINEFQRAGVELRGCELTRKLFPMIIPATEIDWATEYLSLILAVRIVDSVTSAIEHINNYGSGHTEAIVTENKLTADKFIREVDASCVMHNVSTRMHDGNVFGLGAEIGISTQKLHARGTMGLTELTTTKYIVSGTGQIRT